MPVIPALWLRQEDREFKASPAYIERPCFKNKQAKGKLSKMTTRVWKQKA
jgi:hypothetical protein